MRRFVLASLAAGSCGCTGAGPEAGIDGGTVEVCENSAFVVKAPSGCGGFGRVETLDSLLASVATEVVPLAEDELFVVRGDIPRIRQALRGHPFELVDDPVVSADLVQTQPPGRDAWPLGTLDDTPADQDPETFGYPSCDTTANVFVLDTGVWEHPELKGRLVCPGICPADVHGHGTHMATLIAGTGVGVAKNARIHPKRVLDAAARGCASDVAKALEEVIDAELPRSVVNLSLHGPRSDELDFQVQRAVKAGIVVVAAAGNKVESVALSSPAGAPEALTVAGIANFREMPVQGFGEGVDLFAPWGRADAGAAPVEGLPEDYTSPQGSSVATAYASGVVASYWSMHPTWSASDITKEVLERALDKGAIKRVPLGGPPRSPEARAIYTGDLFAGECAGE